MSESTYHQIHFAWAEPTLLGHVGPGPAASSLAESDQPALRSWRDRLLPALTVDYRSALPGTDPADLPETLWAHIYADGQAALVYRWPGDVRDAHAWAVVGPAHGLTLPHILSLHENPNTRPAARRPPDPGWASMPTLAPPVPWERTAAPGAVRTRDRRAAETTVQGEAVLVGAVASALAVPERPIRIALAPEAADLWQATQIRLLWGMHRILHDVLTPPRAIPAAGWQWSFSTYDPDLSPEGRHLAFGPPGKETDGPYADAPPPDHRRAAERLVEVLRDEGGDTLAEYLRERGVPEAPTFGDRRALLLEWLDPRPATAVPVAGAEATGGPDAEEGTDGDEADLPTVEPLPADDEVESAGPLRTVSRIEGSGSPGATDGPGRAGGPGRGEEHTHADERHRPRPYPLSRSVAGAHPSLRLNHLPEDDDGEPLPEAEDLDAPSSVSGTSEHEASACETPTGKEPADRSPAPEAPGPESPGGEAPVRETAAPELPALETPRRQLGPSRVLFGERRPGPTARAEHPIFGAPEPYDPPSTPTDQAPPLNLSRAPHTEPSDPPEEPQEPPKSNTCAPEDLDGPGSSEPESAPARTGARRHAEEAFGGPARTAEEEAHDEATALGAEEENRGSDPAQHERSSEQASPLMVAHDAAPASDYAKATEPETDPTFDDSGANWPTQYADLPLARLERWHSKRGPEGAHTDVVDARAAVRAERSELQRVRGERDHYHAEVQELRREIARLDRPFLDGHGDGEPGSGIRRLPARLLVPVLLLAFLVTGLEAGARFGVSALDMLASLLP